MTLDSIPPKPERSVAERLRALATAHSIELDGDFVLNHEEQELVTEAAARIDALEAREKEMLDAIQCERRFHAGARRSDPSPIADYRCECNLCVVGRKYAQEGRP